MLSGYVEWIVNLVIADGHFNLPKGLLLVQKYRGN